MHTKINKGFFLLMQKLNFFKKDNDTHTKQCKPLNPDAKAQILQKRMLMHTENNTRLFPQNKKLKL
jgi:hypothetical protein